MSLSVKFTTLLGGSLFLGILFFWGFRRVKNNISYLTRILIFSSVKEDASLTVINVYTLEKYVKVKVFPYKPRQAPKAPRIFRQSAHEDGHNV